MGNIFDPIQKLNAIDSVIASNLKPTTKLVYIFLVCRFNNRTAQCNPSQIYIADALKISVRTVQRAIRDLRRAKILNYTLGNSYIGSNRYYLSHSNAGLYKEHQTTAEDIRNDKIVPLHTTPLSPKTMNETMKEEMNTGKELTLELNEGSSSSNSITEEDDFEKNKAAFHRAMKKIGVTLK